MEMIDRRVVLALGVFDLFHIGHLRYLKYAKSLGDYLKVGVLKDQDCLIIKGKLPIIDQYQRLEIIRGISYVDFADLQPCPTEYTDKALKWILEWNVNVVVVGENWAPTDRWKRFKPLLINNGIDVVFSPVTEGISTTEIIRKILSIYKSS